MDFAKKWFKGDGIVWTIFGFLSLVSLVEVYSASSQLAYREAHFWNPIAKHAVLLLIGFLLMLALHRVPFKYLKWGAYVLPLCVLLLVITPFISDSFNEAHRSISIFGQQFQPMELAKISCVIYVAWLLSLQAKPNNPPKSSTLFWLILLGVAACCIPIFIQNFSSSFILFLVCFTMMFIGRMPWKYMTGLVLALALAGTLFVFSLHSMSNDTVKQYVPRAQTWKARIDDFLGHSDDKAAKFEINDDNRQISHAKIAISRGHLIGRIPGRSIERNFIPEAYSDFIYAIIIEECGLIGGIGVLLLYIFLMFRVAIIARASNNFFSKYLSLGCGLLIVIQALMHMAVCVNLIPVTGQPLPLVSKGGTSTILTCLYFGIILSVSHSASGVKETEAPAPAPASEENPEQ